MIKRLSILVFVLTVLAHAQVSGVARRIASGPSLPGTCSQNSVFVRTGATNPGLYDCPNGTGYRFLPIGGNFVMRGVYAAGTTYAALDAVGYNGLVYVSLVGSNVGNQPDTHPLDWANAGPPGPTGAAGANGAPGTSGPTSWVVTTLGNKSGAVTLTLTGTSNDLYTMTLTGDVTLTAVGAGNESFQIDVLQDGTGGHKLSVDTSFASIGAMDPTVSGECLQTFNWVGTAGLARPANSMSCPNATPGLVIGASTPWFMSLPTAKPTTDNCAKWTSTGLGDAGAACGSGGGGTGSTLLDHVGLQTETSLTVSTDNPIYSFSIPSIAAGKCVQGTWAFQHTTGSASLSMKATFGATSISGSSAGTGKLRLQVRVCNRVGVQNAQDLYSLLPDGSFLSSTTITTATPTETTSSPVVLKLTFNPGVTAGNGVTLISGDVEAVQ